jgi:putative tryptophan/tyrosine transport system substrate-binding protein
VKPFKNCVSALGQTVAVCAILVVLWSSSHAEESKKLARIGFLAGTARASATEKGANFAVFLEALRELGYAEGKNVVFQYRNAQGNLQTVPQLVKELVDLNVDVFVSTNPTAIRAAKEMTKSISIVMIITQDPVATGIINSLAHPGANVTGVSLLSRELSGKRLELFQEILPKISVVGVLFAADAQNAETTYLRGYEAAGRTLTIDVQPIEVRGPTPDFSIAFNYARTKRLGALISVRNSLLNSHAKRIADLGVQNRLSVMFEVSEYVAQGGLVSYANKDADSFKRAAVFVDKILKGARPAQLPVEQPTKFELVINLKTAKAIGLTIPPNVLARADRVIK